MHLYDWMVKHGEEDQLLQVRRSRPIHDVSADTRLVQLTNESVEEYLQHKLQNGGEHINPDLLWKYYARRGQHRSAAHALSHLATSSQSVYDLGGQCPALTDPSLMQIVAAPGCARAVPQRGSGKRQVLDSIC